MFPWPQNRRMTRLSPTLLSSHRHLRRRDGSCTLEGRYSLDCHLMLPAFDYWDHLDCDFPGHEQSRPFVLLLGFEYVFHHF